MSHAPTDVKRTSPATGADPVQRKGSRSIKLYGSAPFQCVQGGCPSGCLVLFRGFPRPFVEFILLLFNAILLTQLFT